MMALAETEINRFIAWSLERVADRHEAIEATIRRDGDLGEGGRRLHQELIALGIVVGILKRADAEETCAGC